MEPIPFFCACGPKTHPLFLTSQGLCLVLSCWSYILCSCDNEWFSSNSVVFAQEVGSCCLWPVSFQLVMVIATLLSGAHLPFSCFLFHTCYITSYLFSSIKYVHCFCWEKFICLSYSVPYYTFLQGQNSTSSHENLIWCLYISGHGTLCTVEENRDWELYLIVVFASWEYIFSCKRDWSSWWVGKLYVRSG